MLDCDLMRFHFNALILVFYQLEKKFYKVLISFIQTISVCWATNKYFWQLINFTHWFCLVAFYSIVGCNTQIAFECRTSPGRHYFNHVYKHCLAFFTVCDGNDDCEHDEDESICGNLTTFIKCQINLFNIWYPKFSCVPILDTSFRCFYSK